MPTRNAVYAALDTERLLQQLMIKAKTGNATEEHKPVESFALYIRDYADQLTAQLTRVWGPTAEKQALDTIRKIGALCVAAMEMHGAPRRTFPVLATINGIRMLIQPDMFDAPVKAEGAKVQYDPSQPIPKGTSRRKAAQIKAARRATGKTFTAKGTVRRKK